MLNLPRPSARSRSLPALVAVLAVLLTPALALADEPDAFTKALQKGPLFAGFAALLGGLLTAATPCVYPMIAITVSIFGAREATSRRQAMLLSTSFVLGIMALFTPMLVGAALTGSLFGSLLSSKVVILFIVAVFAAMAASMFGAFDLVLPEGIMQRVSTVGGIGYGGAFLLGLVSGIVAAPCTGPVLTGIILWIGQSHDVVLGSVVGAMFSLGLGIPVWLVGTFAMALPKGGKWMLSIKSFFGIVMSVAALYFLKNAFPVMKALARHDTKFMLIMLAFVAVGLALGAVHLAWDDGGAFIKFRKAIGIVVSTVAAFLLWTSFDLPKETQEAIVADIKPEQILNWEHSEQEASNRARTEKRPLMVDFTADWCGACKELAKHTFSDPRVMAQATKAKFIAVKVDATNDEDPQVDAVKSKYKVVGLPTVVIYDSTGKERKRFNEFVEPEPFLAAISGID
ncbi:MAG: cytochrome c biogenesis protein CcdA [Minicystis sp.]